MKKSKFTEATNRLCLEAGGNRHSRSGSVPENRHLGSDIFQLETEVFRIRNSGVTATAAARDENSRLKQVVADLMLDKQMLQDVLKKSSEGARSDGS